MNKRTIKRQNMSNSANDTNKVPKIILWAPKGQMYQIYGKLNINLC